MTRFWNINILAIAVALLAMIATMSELPQAAGQRRVVETTSTRKFKLDGGIRKRNQVRGGGRGLSEEEGT